MSLRTSYISGLPDVPQNIVHLRSTRCPSEHRTSQVYLMSLETSYISGLPDVPQNVFAFAQSRTTARKHQIRSVNLSSELFLTWRKYDADCSGYIEANELKSFLRDLLKKANRHYDDKKLQEYTQTILKMFDANGDGKLGLSEMARLLPVQENFLLRFQDDRGSKGMKLNAEEFNAIFTFYDRDGNGYIDSQELDALLKDLYEKNKKEMDIKKMTAYKKNILSLSHGGKLYRRELEMILCTEPL
ncbi:calretinin-like [Hemitrygon akajei]|uniref:calretinin-like n=1 Tax=Hemitrygon akajei TaxID=2704970 RepID=UPI003BF9A581